MSDLLLTNGRFYTLNPARPWAGALAIRDGRILAVGNLAAVEAAVPGAMRIDLEDRMVMPGFADVHNHILMAGQAALTETTLPEGASVQAICDHVRKRAVGTPPGQWIIANQLGADRIAALNSDAAFALLNAASPDHPVLLRDETVHNRWVNAAALSLAGITGDSADPPGGSFGRDPDSGRLTGILIEAAAGIVERIAAADFTAAMAEQAVEHAVGVANSYGITAFQDAASVLPVLSALSALDRRGRLNAWAVASLPLIEPSFMFGTSGEALLALRADHRTAHVRPDFTKIFLDGVPGTRTAAFHLPYLADAAHPQPDCGALLVELPALVRAVALSESLGMGLKIHCTGDRAVTAMLDAVEIVRQSNGQIAIPHHIAHASYIRDEDIPRFAALGVVADLSPMIWYPTSFLEGHRQVLGQARADRFWPVASLLKAGALLAGGSDWPVSPIPDPWQGIAGLVTRQNPSGAFAGQALWPEQSIGLGDAIRLFTLNAAQAMGLGNKTGSLQPGKSADLIVLDRHVFDVPPEQIARTCVLQTWFEGRPVFTRHALSQG